jgi:hypothetical protein
LILGIIKILLDGLYYKFFGRALLRAAADACGHEERAHCHAKE